MKETAGSVPAAASRVVLAEVDDVLAQRRVVDEARERRAAASRRSATRGRVAAGDAEGDRRVVVLDVELPGHAAGSSRSKIVGRSPKPPGGMRVGLRGSPGVAVDPVQVVPDAAAGDEREEAVEEDVLVGEVPVEGQVAAVVVAHRRARVGDAEVDLGLHEAVHPPAVLLRWRW